MKPQKPAHHAVVDRCPIHPFECCAFQVVVYRAPGPDQDTIGACARRVAARNAVGRTTGGLAYLTLVASDFDRLWKGVERGDALGTAYSVLKVLGPGVQQFIGREDDFILGWIGGTDGPWGDVLLLEVFPRPHLWSGRN
jgi:hypothetical protein